MVYTYIHKLQPLCWARINITLKFFKRGTQAKFIVDFTAFQYNFCQKWNNGIYKTQNNCRSDCSHYTGVSRKTVYAIRKRMDYGESVNRGTGNGRKTVVDRNRTSFGLNKRRILTAK